MSHPLIKAGARANLCFHDIADDQSVIYTLPMGYLLEVVDGLRAQGISERVRIYFDDGYASLVETVHTLKQRYPEIEIVAALTLGFLERPGHIGWADVEALHGGGVSIAAHGREHLHMDELIEPEILVQLTESRDALKPYGTDEFVFPYGSYNETVIGVNNTHELFPVLTTIDYGWDHGQALRPRLMVTSQITPAEVLERLATPA